MCTLKLEFGCSQRKLFETIENLYRQGVIRGYLWDNPDKDILGNLRLQIKKDQIERVNAGEIMTFKEIGYIKISAINDDWSLLQAPDGNPALNDFFDYLVEILGKYIPERTPDLMELDKYAAKWINRGYVRKKGYNMEQFLSDEDAPRWLTPKTLQRYIRKKKKI